MAKRLIRSIDLSIEEDGWRWDQSSLRVRMYYTYQSIHPTTTGELSIYLAALIFLICGHFLWGGRRVKCSLNRAFYAWEKLKQPAAP